MITQAFAKVEALPLAKDPPQILVRWTLLPSSESLADYEFYIDRGEAENQLPNEQHKTIDGNPLIPAAPVGDSVNVTQIAGPINGLDFYQYRDFAIPGRNLYQRWFYQIRMRKISTQEEAKSALFTWDGNLDLVGLYIVDENNFLLEDTTGAACLVHPRRRGGASCTECFDKVQQKRTKSNCMTCFGTNWVGGFYPAINVFIDFNPSPNPTLIQEWGETQPNQTTIFLANYPQLVAGDVIRELRPHKLWRVTNTKQTEKRRTPMLQFAQVVEITPGDIEYKLPYDIDLTLKLIAQLDQLRAQREF